MRHRNQDESIAFFFIVFFFFFFFGLFIKISVVLRKKPTYCQQKNPMVIFSAFLLTLTRYLLITYATGIISKFSF